MAERSDFRDLVGRMMPEPKLLDPKTASLWEQKPMPERETTVIERMVTKYINTLNHQPEDCRDATLAMLAAVRELEEALRFSGRIYASSSVQEMGIEHERRAGGKGE